MAMRIWYGNTKQASKWPVGFVTIARPYCSIDTPTRPIPYR